MFRGDIRKTIQQSDLFYLFPEGRRSILSESTSLKIEDINTQISLIFEGHNLQEDGNYGLIGYKQLIIISNLCSSYKEFLELIFNNKIKPFLDIDEVILRQIVKICASKEDFINICSHRKIAHVVVQKQEWNLFYIFKIINNISELFEVLENTEFIYIITKSNSNNLEFILAFLNIHTIIQIKELLEDGKWEHIKKLLKNGTTGNIKDILNLNEENSLMIPSGIIDFNKIWIVGTCSDADAFNLQGSCPVTG